MIDVSVTCHMSPTNSRLWIPSAYLHVLYPLFSSVCSASVAETSQVLQVPFLRPVAP
jgi:hypothetical protein